MRDWTGACFKIENGRLLVLDQTKLPDVENWVVASTPDDMITLILDLRFAHHALPSTPLLPCASCVRCLAFLEWRCVRDEATEPSRSRERFLGPAAVAARRRSVVVLHFRSRFSPRAARRRRRCTSFAVHESS